MSSNSFSVDLKQEIGVHISTQPILVIKSQEMLQTMTETKLDPGAVKMMTKDTILALERWNASDAPVSAYYEVITPQGLHISNVQINLAEKAGFVSIKRGPNSWSRFEVKRSTAAVPKPKFRRPSKNSKWPWTFVQHWYVINNCPLRLVNDSFINLSLKHVSNNWRERRNRIMQIDNEFPAIRRKQTLRDLRKVLEEVLIHENIIDEEMRAKYRQWLVTPQHVVRTLISIGVQPKFDNGKIVKFEPMDLDKQVDIAQSLVADLDARFLEDIGNLIKSHDIVPPEMVDTYIARVSADATEKAQVEAEFIEKVLSSVKNKAST